MPLVRLPGQPSQTVLNRIATSDTLLCVSRVLAHFDVVQNFNCEKVRVDLQNTRTNQPSPPTHDPTTVLLDNLMILFRLKLNRF